METIICAICGYCLKRKKYNGHIIKHGITPEQYYLTYINPDSKCKNKFCDNKAIFMNIFDGYRPTCGHKDCVSVLTNKMNRKYWYNKGFSEEQTEIQLSKIQSKNGKRFQEKRRKNPENYKFPNQVAYWIDRGFTEEESKIKCQSIKLLFR